jgi:hypothetical protein
LRIGNRLSDLASDAEPSKTKKDRFGTHKLLLQNKQDQLGNRRVSHIAKSDLKKLQKKTREKTKKELINEIEEIRKNGVTHLRLKMKVLFTGSKTITVRLDKPLSTLEDCFVTISVENSLMSNQQLEALNPLMIKIEKLCDLPDTPVKIETLKSKCAPVYCSYTFFKGWY